MRKYLILICFIIFISAFFTYQIKFKSNKTYIIEDGIPYFKEENDVLKIYPQQINDEDLISKATVYDVLERKNKK